MKVVVVVVFLHLRLRLKEQRRTGAGSVVDKRRAATIILILFYRFTFFSESINSL